MLHKIDENFYLDLDCITYIAEHSDAVYILTTYDNKLTIDLKYKDKLFEAIKMYGFIV